MRQKIKSLKEKLTVQERLDAANAVFSKLQQADVFLRADNILLYHSLPDELSTAALIDYWHLRKRIFLPRVCGLELEILPYNGNNLKRGAYNIKEPQGDNLYKISDIDLIIVPAIAFDHNCNRIGRGKGYYDRLLSDLTAVKIGIGYDFQLIEEDIAVEPHDICLDMVITPSYTIIHHDLNF